MTVDIADRITREHKISSIGGNGKTEIVFCICGLRCENEDDGDDGFLAGYWRHVAIVTEVAVRQQLAAEVWALERDADTMRREVWEGKSIMWVQGWDAAVLTAGRIVHGEPILAAGGRS